MAFDVQTYLAAQGRRVDEKLDRVLPSVAELPVSLHAAMRHSVLLGGKRLRPILCLAAAVAAGGSEEDAWPPALAVELLHAYTLVHDDLPCMDNDLLRRGQPTTHVQFGEACAVLAGDALQTLAFELAASTPRAAAAVVRELATAAGSLGVVGGQMADIEAEGGLVAEAALLWIHVRKTAGLLRAALRMGARAAGADEAVVDSLGHFGDRIGLAFQMADDVLNAAGDASTLGKAAGSDQARGKLTAVAVYGLEGARERGHALVETARGELHVPGDPDVLLAVADYVMTRTR